VTVEIRFDAATSLQLLAAVRLLEGRLVAEGRQLCPGMVELSAIAERSMAARSDQLPRNGAGDVQDASHADDVLVPRLLSIEDVAHRLHVSDRSARRIVEGRQVPVVKVGAGSVRVDPRDLESLIEERKES